MGQLLLLLVVALTVAAVVFGVVVLVTGRDPGLVPVEPDGRSVPLPGNRPLAESDIGVVRFDTALRGYRMDQVDQALRRAAYDIGYKAELIGVLEAEVDALRNGRLAEADRLRESRLAAAGGASAAGNVTTGALATGPTATAHPTPEPAAGTDAASGQPSAEKAATPVEKTATPAGDAAVSAGDATTPTGGTAAPAVGDQETTVAVTDSEQPDPKATRPEPA